MIVSFQSVPATSNSGVKVPGKLEGICFLSDSHH